MNTIYLILIFVVIPIAFILVWFLSKKLTSFILKDSSKVILKKVGRFIRKPKIDLGKKRLITFTHIISFALYITLIYLALSFLFKTIPQTRIIGEKLLNIIYEPLKIAFEIIYQILLITLKFAVIGILAYLIIWITSRLLNIIVARGINRKAKVKKSTINIIFKVIKTIIVLILAAYFIFSIPITHSPYFYWTLIGIVSLLILIFLPKILDIISGLIIPFVYNISPGDLIKIDEKIGLITDIDLLSIQIEKDGGIRDQLPTRTFLWKNVRIICQDYEKLPIWLNIEIFGTKADRADELLKKIKSNKIFKNSEISSYITWVEDDRITLNVNITLQSPENFWLARITAIDIINRFLQANKIRCRITSEIEQLTRL
ncbi:MAG: mechanosensitive ion channel domain-containing protein [bacterium]